jgi:hypothetical protein
MKKTCLISLALVLCGPSAFAQDAPRSFDSVLHDLAIATSTLDTLATQLQAIAAKQSALSAELQQALTQPVVADATSLQATLNQGGIIHLVGGTVYPGAFTLGSNTTLLCHGASLTGSATAPTIAVALAAQNVVIDGCTLTVLGLRPAGYSHRPQRHLSDDCRAGPGAHRHPSHQHPDLPRQARDRGERGGLLHHRIVGAGRLRPPNRLARFAGGVDRERALSAVRHRRQRAQRGLREHHGRRRLDEDHQP